MAAPTCDAARLCSPHPGYNNQLASLAVPPACAVLDWPVLLRRLCDRPLGESTVGNPSSAIGQPHPYHPQGPGHHGQRVACECTPEAGPAQGRVAACSVVRIRCQHESRPPLQRRVGKAPQSREMPTLDNSFHLPGHASRNTRRHVARAPVSRRVWSIVLMNGCTELDGTGDNRRAVSVCHCYKSCCKTCPYMPK